MDTSDIAADRLRSFIERIERLNEEIKALNADKSEVFKEAKSTGFDVKVMRAVIQRRAKDGFERDEFDELLELYERAIREGGTGNALRVHAHDFDEETGEIHDDPIAEPDSHRGDAAHPDTSQPAQSAPAPSVNASPARHDATASRIVTTTKASPAAPLTMPEIPECLRVTA